VQLRIDEAYIPDMNQRLTVYRRIAAARSEEAIGGVLDEVRDRYGPLPDSLLVLAEHARIRLLADRLRLEAVDRDGRFVVFKFRQDTQVDPVRLARLVGARHDLRLVPPSSVRLDLEPPVLSPGTTERPASPTGARPGQSVSWWTARARAGEVAPGFSKEAILREAPGDPRAPGGLFERLGGLLEELANGGS